MRRKLFILLLLIPIIPAVWFAVRGRDTEPAAAQAATAAEPSRPEIPGEAVTIPVRFPKTDAAPVPEAGERLDVCVARGRLLKALAVRAVACRRGAAQCAVFVRVPKDRSIAVMAGYDVERPPIAMTPGAAC